MPLSAIPMNGASTPNQPGHDDATYNTALRGAFLAFQKTATTPTTYVPATPISTATPTRETANGHGNGALIAATSASRDRSLAQSPSLSLQTTGNNGTPSRHNQAMGQAHLQSTMGDARSPSLIAATLAASRSGSPNPKPAPLAQLSLHHHHTAQQRKGNLGDNSTASSVLDADLMPDSSSIGPTNALVSLFERKEGESDPAKKRPAPISGNKKGLRVGLRPMTPPRTMSPVLTYETSPSRLASSLAWEKVALPSPCTESSPAAPSSTPQRIEGLPGIRKQPPPAPPSRNKAHTEVAVSAPLNLKKKTRPITPPPRAIRQSNALVVSPQPIRTSSQQVISKSSDPSPASSTQVLDKPMLQHQTRAHSTTMPSVATFTDTKDPGLLIRRSSSSSSNDTFVSASSAPSLQPDSPRKTPEPSLPLRPPSVPNTSILPPPRLPVLQPSSHLALDSLTNAIVAGSLASARATPTIAKPPTPPPSRRQIPHIRQTLRAPRTKSEEELTGVGSQHRKPLGKLSSRKKHAHREGARKRWREEITARERQRYEGVWASNRGLLLDGPNAILNGLGDASQLVANVVARDIWTRSRLPFDELAEVWDLVDTEGRGALDRAQFVVGMWLIDQRLRGRKIPRKVSDSVWGSAKGVRVLGPKIKS
ncbi:hypothetical protein F5B22DRAFT_585841 [Xylaria bambusicola]|uniref:uncharacterized protein n=1 Tax=Xylaria bambusicola TaxID=326684 RepID=UPI002008E66D|nr:uncharacterized protein F5B22DRAFT_585841 [Xylaria bambusicola]KAI0526459.1 hypothetical protein F5B22DRAFT_585841 [Xylaria bambusicola]